MNLIRIAVFFVDIDKQILRCLWKFKGPIIGKTILKKNNRVRESTFLALILYRATTDKRLDIDMSIDK